MELNKLYKGDAYELIKQVPDKSIDLIYTDPPYNFGKFNKNNFGSRLVDEHKIQEQTAKDINKISNGIDYKILDEFVRVMKHIYIYIYMV